MSCMQRWMQLRPDPDYEFLTIREMCERMEKTRATIHSYMRAGMPFIKIKHSTLFKPQAVKEWFEEQTVRLED